MDAKQDTPTLGPALVLTIALGGMFLVRLSEQLVSTSVAEIRGDVSPAADAASWISTVYTMATFVGIVLAVPVIRTFGLGRYLAASYVAFSLTAIGCALTTDFGATITLRAIQGFAGGGMGPAAFVAVFMIASGARLALMGAILAFLLIFPTTLGPVVAGMVENAFGWHSQYLFQATLGAALAVASIAIVPRQPPSWAALKTDWTALTLLCLVLALFALVLGQGTRRFWFESDLIFWSSVAALSAFAGFVFLARVSGVSILQPRLLVTRKFGIANGLNLLARATLVLTSYLLPQFLLMAHGYGQLEISHLMLWAAIPQLITLPVTWWLLHRLDLRWVMSAGFVLCALAAALLMNNTSISATDQFRLPLALFAIGQAFFLLPAIVVGTEVLKPPDLPTASLAFNTTTVGGTLIGTGLLSHLVMEREKLHSSALTVAAQAKREAWTLAFNDAYLILAIVLVMCALSVFAMGRSPPLRART